jgi:electron transport complex protein RnfG
MSAAEPSAFRLVATLGFAGLVSGIALVTAYELTLPRIEANRTAALEAAVFDVLPGSVRVERLAWQDGRLAPSTDPKASEVVYAGRTETNELVGYAIPSEGPGFQDTIALIYGVDPRRERIVGMRVLDSRETPGLGDKILKDAHFLESFQDLAVEPEVVAVKKGSRAAPHEIDAITGATISSKAVVRIVNAGNARWLDRLAAGTPVGKED